MDKVFNALSSIARRKILAYLNEQELTAGEIAARFDFSKPALSNHLKILEDAELISRKKIGQYVYFSINTECIENTVLLWSMNFCPVSRPLKKETKSEDK